MRLLLSTLLITLFFSSTVFTQSAGNALNFDGTDDYVSTSLPTVFNSITNNDITIETWVKPTGSSFCRILFAQLNSSNFLSVSLSASNEVYFYVNNTVGMNTTASLPSNQWTHLACVWHSSTSSMEIYFDGVLQTIVSGGSSSLGNDNLMTIGAKTNASQFFSGELDELRIWSEARTACQIAGLMNTDYTTAQTNLIAYYDFNEGVAGGSNTGITTLNELNTNYNGTLNGFVLSGTSSNWIASGANITQTNQSPPLVQTTDVLTICDSIQWIDGNTYYSDNNTATHTITGGVCDSLVSLDLTVVYSSGSTDILSTCDSLVWLDGNTYYSSNNTATYITTNNQGCDSVITLDLTVNQIDTSLTQNNFDLTSNQLGATYQWLDCDNGNSPISGETSQTFSASSNGNYAVEVTLNGCTDTSTCFNISGLGINSNKSAEFGVYPNPTNGDFTIDLRGLHTNILVKIYAPDGRIISEKKYLESEMINTSIIGKSGIYLIQIRTDESISVLPVIKQ